MDNIQITDFTFNGKCSNCGQCCSNLLPLSDSEVKRIKQYIKKHNIKEQRHNAMIGVDMTGEVYAKIPKRFCPICGREIGGNNEQHRSV